MNETAPGTPKRLFTYDFTVLPLAATFGFCNIAVFSGFTSYLERLGIDAAWRGWLLGAEPLAVGPGHVLPGEHGHHAGNLPGGATSNAAIRPRGTPARLTPTQRCCRARALLR